MKSLWWKEWQNDRSVQKKWVWGGRMWIYPFLTHVWPRQNKEIWIILFCPLFPHFLLSKLFERTLLRTLTSRYFYITDTSIFIACLLELQPYYQFHGLFNNIKRYWNCKLFMTRESCMIVFNKTYLVTVACTWSCPWDILWVVVQNIYEVYQIDCSSCWQK